MDASGRVRTRPDLGTWDLVASVEVTLGHFLRVTPYPSPKRKQRRGVKGKEIFFFVDLGHLGGSWREVGGQLERGFFG